MVAENESEANIGIHSLEVACHKEMAEWRLDWEERKVEALARLANNGLAFLEIVGLLFFDEAENTLVPSEMDQRTEVVAQDRQH